MLNSRFHWWIFAGIVVFAAAIRLWQLGHIPVSLYWDEMAMYVDAKSMLATGQDMHGRSWQQFIFPSYGDYKLAPYLWAATLASGLFGLSEASIRLPSAVAGVLTVIVAGQVAVLLCVDWSSKRQRLVQYLTMIAVATMPWSIQFSREGFEGHLAQLFVALAVWASLQVSGKRRWLWLLVVVACSAAATYTYYSAQFVVLPIVILALCWQELRQTHASWKIWLSSLVTIIVGFVVLLQPLQHAQFFQEMNTFRLGTDSVLRIDRYVAESNLAREKTGNTILSRVFYHRRVLQARAFLENVGDHFTLNYLFFSGDPNLRHGTGYFGILLLATAPFLLAGLWYVWRHKVGGAIILTGWWGLALVPASVPENTPHALRSLNGLVPVGVLVGIGAVFLWDICLPNLVKKKTWRQAIAAAFVAIFALNLAAFLAHYFVVYPKISANAWQAGYKPLAEEVSRIAHSSPQQKISIHPFDDRFYLWVMGYGAYQPAEFHTWKSQGFSFQAAVPGIVFQPITSNAEQNQVTVGGYLDMLKIYPASELLVVKNEVGEDAFAIHQPSPVR